MFNCDLSRVYPVIALRKNWMDMFQFQPFILKGTSGSVGLTPLPDDSGSHPVKIGWLKFSGSPKPLP